MRTISTFILILLLLTSCLEKNSCENRFDFISSNDSIPILDLDITKHPDTVRKELSDLYGFDLCKKCAQIDFKLPMIIEGQQGFFKFSVDFDSPYCENCPAHSRLRYYYSIWINHKNQIFVDGALTDIDSLQTYIGTYLAGIGTKDLLPKTFKQVNFRILWSQGSDIEFLKSVLTKIHNSHLVFVESKLINEYVDFCKMNKKEIAFLKEKYPLNIEFDLGAINKNAPPTIEELQKFESIEVAEETELKIENYLLSFN